MRQNTFPCKLQFAPLKLISIRFDGAAFSGIVGFSPRESLRDAEKNIRDSRIRLKELLQRTLSPWHLSGSVKSEVRALDGPTKERGR
jgi:hypothetical protein